MVTPGNVLSRAEGLAQPPKPHLAAGQGFVGGGVFAGLLALLVDQLLLLVGGELGGVLFPQDHAADRHLALQALAVAVGGLQLGCGGTGVKAQQHIALFHRLAIADKHRFDDPRDQGFDVLHRLNRLQFARHRHGFIQRCDGCPQASKGHAAHQAPHQHVAVAVGFFEQHRLAETPGFRRWLHRGRGFVDEGVRALLRLRFDRSHQLNPSSLWL